MQQRIGEQTETTWHWHKGSKYTSEDKTRKCNHCGTDCQNWWDELQRQEIKYRQNKTANLGTEQVAPRKSGKKRTFRWLDKLNTQVEQVWLVKFSFFRNCLISFTVQFMVVIYMSKQRKSICRSYRKSCQNLQSVVLNLCFVYVKRSWTRENKLQQIAACHCYVTLGLYHSIFLPAFLNLNKRQSMSEGFLTCLTPMLAKKLVPVIWTPRALLLFSLFPL